MVHTLQWHRGGRGGSLPAIEAGLRLLLRLAAPVTAAGGGASAAPAHRLFTLNAIPRLAQVDWGFRASVLPHSAQAPSTSMCTCLRVQAGCWLDQGRPLPSWLLNAT